MELNLAYHWEKTQLYQQTFMFQDRERVMQNKNNAR